MKSEAAESPAPVVKSSRPRRSKSKRVRYDVDDDADPDADVDFDWKPVVKLEEDLSEPQVRISRVESFLK